MMMWIFYSLLAAILWAIVNITDKYTMSKLLISPMIPLLILAVVGLVSAAVIYGAYGYVTFTSFDLVQALLAGLFYLLTMFFYYLALKHDEVSKVIPIFYLASVFILFIARAFLDEQLTSQQDIGVAFLVVGAILISTKSLLNFRVGLGVGYMLVAAFCYALNQVLTKYLLKHYEFWSVFSYIRIGIFLSLLPIFCWNFREIIMIGKKINYRAYKIMTINQLLNLMGVFAITLAMISGYVTLVNALASVQPFFVLVLSLLLSFLFPNILKEIFEGSVLIKKFAGTILIIIGVWIIS